MTHAHASNAATLRPMVSTPTPLTFERLCALGLFSTGDIFAGIQFDLNVAYTKSTPRAGRPTLPVREVHYCDHNCTLEQGGYDCPAAYTKNKGMDPKSLAPAADVLAGIRDCANALRSLREPFTARLTELGYPQVITAAAADRARIEVNLFGGNPELHPDIHDIIATLTADDYAVTLTTTGGKFFDERFTERLLEHPPTRIALSADDLPTDPDAIRSLAAMSPEELKRHHRQINPIAGQKRKAVEAIHTANLARHHPQFPPVMFNFVVHPGNVDRALDVMRTLGELYPECQVNPYPAQSAFAAEPVAFTPEQAAAFEQILDYVIELHTRQLSGPTEVRIVPRLHYYLLLKAIYQAYSADYARIAALLSGYGLWRCYTEATLTGRYLQVGGSGGQPAPLPLTNAAGDTLALPSPGGHPGCFWNAETVTNPSMVVWHSSARAIRQHVDDMGTLAARAAQPCAGCGFPRLTFDEPSVVAGIPADSAPLRTAYLALRMAHVGY